MDEIIKKLGKDLDMIIQEDDGWYVYTKDGYEHTGKTLLEALKETI